VKRSTKNQRPPKPHDAGSTREAADPATPRANDDDPKAETRPLDDDPNAELRALDEAWSDILDPRLDGLHDRSLFSLMFAALVGGPYEDAEGDSPAVAVLRAIRETVEGWAHAHSGSTLFASVAFADLHMMTRRIDVAIQIVRQSPGGIR
jgi:hypothetical protein